MFLHSGKPDKLKFTIATVFNNHISTQFSKLYQLLLLYQYFLFLLQQFLMFPKIRIKFFITFFQGISPSTSSSCSSILAVKSTSTISLKYDFKISIISPSSGINYFIFFYCISSIKRVLIVGA